MLRKLVSIHGINSAAPWQEQIERVFAPHFDVITIRYKDYRRFGASRLAFGSAWFLLLVPLAIATVVLGFLFRSTAVAWSAAVLLGFAFVIAACLASSRRSKVLNNFKTELDERIPTGDSPHLIAHSFGTFLAAHALLKFPNVSFRRVIFAGCVLPRHFRWNDIFSRNLGEGFVHLRNEIAAKDWIPRIAAFSKLLLLPGFGGAGVFGFIGSKEYIHTVTTPAALCTHCQSTHFQARIHNVLYSEYVHSDHFVGVGHAESFWLPYFWDIEPCEFRDFVDFCSLASCLEDELDLHNLSIVEEELRNRHWNWAGATLAAFIESQIISWVRDERRAENLVARAVRLTWRAVEEAASEQHKAERNITVVRRLHPRFAVCAAVAAVLKVEVQDA